MGIHVCQFGVTHKVCRCPETHEIKCNKVSEHQPAVKLCLVMQMRLDGRLYMPKHLAFHEPHDWWYTSWGGGHQLAFYDPDEKNVTMWHCPGMRF